jgi:hypothetical protein
MTEPRLAVICLTIGYPGRIVASEVSMAVGPAASPRCSQRSLGSSPHLPGLSPSAVGTSPQRRSTSAASGWSSRSRCSSPI